MPHSVPKVLLVSSSAELSEFFRQCLGRMRCRVHVAVPEACEEILLRDKSPRIELVLLDMHAAMTRWRQIAQAARQVKPQPIPLLMILSENAFDSETRHELQASADAVLTTAEFSLPRFEAQLNALLQR